MTVLLIEDDEETAAYIARGLRERGDVVDLAVIIDRVRSDHGARQLY